MVFQEHATGVASHELPTSPASGGPNISIGPSPTSPVGDIFLQPKPKTPIIIGLYGLPGCGKSYLLNALRTDSDGVAARFRLFEGSEVIGARVPGGLDAFKSLNTAAKTSVRREAVTAIRDECMATGQAGVVVGHFSFIYATSQPEPAWTSADTTTYTHIIYLAPDPAVISARRNADGRRARPSASTAALAAWQEFELETLTKVCKKSGIVLAIVKDNETGPIRSLLDSFHPSDETRNMARAIDAARRAILIPGGAPRAAPPRRVLVFDGDRTLAPHDAGGMLWNQLAQARWGPLRDIFAGPLGFTYSAFQQVAVAHESRTTDEEYRAGCRAVAQQVTMYEPMVEVLKRAHRGEDTEVLIVTCGSAMVWEEILRAHGLPDTIKVIGSGRLSDLIVTAHVKEQLVACLKFEHGVSVTAFGDSYLDLRMLVEADRAVVVVGPDDSRSRTMERCLEHAIDEYGLRASQAIMAAGATPRLQHCRGKLPGFRADAGAGHDDPYGVVSPEDMIRSVLVSDLSCTPRRPATTGGSRPAERIHDLTGLAGAQILATPTRDVRNSGPQLREHHRRVGNYLAATTVANIIGTEPCPFVHVQQQQQQQHGATPPPQGGVRLCDEERTTIVAAMRGGEPLALGMHEIFPLSMFVHARAPGDVEPCHVLGQRTLVLVDSVINSGKTVAEFVAHVRGLHSRIRIVVVTAVAQAKSVGAGGALRRLVEEDGNAEVVCLRVSTNEYKGTRGVDTGNRLFGTQHLA